MKCQGKTSLLAIAVLNIRGLLNYLELKIKGSFLKRVFVKNERGYRLNAIKSPFDRY